MSLWFRLGRLGRFALLSRPPPGDILPASAFRVWSIAGGGRGGRCSLVTLPSRPGLEHPRPALRPPYLQIRGAGPHPSPAASPPDVITAIKSTISTEVTLHARPTQTCPHCRITCTSLTFLRFTDTVSQIHFVFCGTGSRKGAVC